MPETTLSYKVEVHAIGESRYSSNGLRFATEDEAKRYGADLFMRWFGIDDWRVTESSDAVTHQIDENNVMREVQNG